VAVTWLLENGGVEPAPNLTSFELGRRIRDTRTGIAAFAFSMAPVAALTWGHWPLFAALSGAAGVGVGVGVARLVKLSRSAPQA